VLRRVRHVVRHPISQNVVALGWIQIATFVVPLVTLPYVARVLPPSEFGIVVFATSFSIVLALVIDWGFGYYGVRAVAQARDDPGKLAAVVAHVRGAQLLLSLGSAFVALACLVVVPKLSSHPAYVPLAWIAAVSTGLTTDWYFVGMERVRLVAAIQLGLRVFSAALTFVFVRNAGDGWVVLALYAASSVAMWLALDFIMYREVPVRLTSLRDAVDGVRGAGTLFVGTVAATLYTSFNVLLLGLFVPAAQIAKFGGAERVLRSSVGLLGPVGAAVYPRLVHLQSSGRRDRARQLLTVAVAAVGTAGLVLAGGLALFAPLIMRIIYGAPYVHQGAPILRILSLIIPFSIVGAVSGAWLMTLHMDRRIVTIVVCAGVLNVVLGCILTPLLGPTGMAWSVVCAEAAAAAGGLFTVVRSADRVLDASLDSAGEPQAIVLAGADGLGHPDPDLGTLEVAAGPPAAEPHAGASRGPANGLSRPVQDSSAEGTARPA